MNTALGYRKKIQPKALNQYRQNEILNASPTELILKLYDLAIVSIKKNDIAKANQVITELISALNFEYQEVALGFFRLYRYCQQNLNQGNTQEPLMILQQLRDTWAKAFNLD